MARAFDGIDDEATNSTAFSTLITASAGTFCIWYRPVGTPTTESNIWKNDGLVADGTSQYVGLHRANISGGGDRIYAYNWDSNEDRIGALLTVGTWNHWTWLHTGGNLSLFKDGVSQGSIASGDTGNLLGTLRLGKSSGLSNWLEGDLAELAIWNVALSPLEIAALPYISPLGIRESALQIYTPLWGIHSPEIDLTRNNRSLTLVGTLVTRHAPVVPFSQRYWAASTEPEAAAGGDAVPQVWAQYRRRRAA